MVEISTPASAPGSSALEREADYVDKLMDGQRGGEASKAREDGENGTNNPTQVEQDSRIAKAQAEAKAAGGGPDKPEDGLNQDG